ncbi:MAG: transcription termination/antitermination protein NusA [Firmicutes bacterium]|nr:transcription termination/antitermination protein NusA [Bacillota bacterium]
MNYELIDALRQLEKERGISGESLFEAIEAAVISAYKRHFGLQQNVRVNLDRDTGQMRVFNQRNVVEQVDDPRLEMSVEDAAQLGHDAQPGDIVETEVTPQDFGRIAAQTAKQVVVQRIREAERGAIYEEFINRESDIVTGKVHRHDGRNILIDLGRTDAILLPSERVPAEDYRPGDRLKTYITEVRRTTKGPQIFVSRTHPGLLKRLFELEVPEIHDGIVLIKAVAREPGIRSKIAVSSTDDNVDPVGACVGPRGTRVQAVVAELKGEKIDIVRWGSAATDFVANALSPAKVITVRVDESNRVAQAIVPDHQLSLAIGKEGQNARLAAKLTGWRIDIKSETQYRALYDEKAARLKAQAELEQQAKESADESPADESPAGDEPRQAEGN